MTRFARRHAVVTGAASGIGFETARRLAAEGGRVVLVDVDGPGTQAACTTLAGTGHRAGQMDVTDEDMPTRPLLDFKAGYVLRALDRFPRQGERAPWHLVMSYAEDVKHLRKGRVEDDALRFFAAGERSTRPAGDLVAAA